MDAPPGRKPEVDVRRLGDRIESFGVAIPRGEEAMVTGVEVIDAVLAEGA